jgi:hypothetical protein
MEMLDLFPEQIGKRTVLVKRAGRRPRHLHLLGFVQLLGDSSDVLRRLAFRLDLFDVSPCPMLVRHLLFHFMQVPHLPPQQVGGWPVFVE